MMPWPRLSETLPHRRALDCCQSCGGADDLRVWQEHDDMDRPERIYLVLCHTCAAEIIGPPPRLYRCLDRWAPGPGIMPTCQGCVHQKDLGCRSPLLKANGGPGLPVRSSVAAEGIACSRGRGCRRFIEYGTPPVCDGREPKATP